MLSLSKLNMQTILKILNLIIKNKKYAFND